MKQDGQFILFTCEEFREWLFKTQFKRRIGLFQEHHTYDPSYKNFNGSNHFALLKGMKDYHVNNRKFSNIAQNLTTFPDGTIAVCRPFDVAPAGIKGANVNGLCIENLGNFDVGGDVMSVEQNKTIIFLTAVLCMRFNLQPNVNTIGYHHWWDLDTGERKNGAGSTKTCPGTNWFGGNTIEAAQKFFIPLVASAIKELSTPNNKIDTELENAINFWTSVGVISDPEGLKKDFAAGVIRSDRVRGVLVKTANYMKKG